MDMTHTHSSAHSHDCCGEEGIRPWQAVTAALMLAAGLIVTHAGPAWAADRWLQLAWYLIAFLPVGLGVVREAVEHALKGDPFSEFMLMAVAAVGAFLIGEYPEAVAVMLLYQIGEMLQDRAVDRARDNIRSLLALRPDHATVVLPDGSTAGRDPAAVAVGEEIIVRPGARVPLDGELISGAMAFDTAALTGEAQPRTVATGGEVLAGMIATTATARLRVTRPAGESAVARILQMVEEASARKAPTELFIRRFAHVYTPTVMGLAVLVAVVPWLVSLAAGTPFDWATWVSRALVFLVISCPCALVISIPLGYFAGIGAASRRGILFKGGGSIDALCRIDTVAFDKTGTLTTGRFTVTAAEGLSADDIAAVAAIEGGSTHPIAEAIADYARSLGLTPVPREGVSDIAGYGLEAGEWLVGTPRLLAERGIATPETLAGEAATLVAVARGGRYLGHLALSDTPKSDAREAVLRLGTRRTVILSGDRQGLVDALARTLGVAEAHGDLLPEGKADRISALQAEGHRVAFVGDGVNDAPVLALSDVGVAMGALGADAAVETADVVVETDQPSKVAEAIAVSLRTRRIVRENIVLALGLKAAVMLLGLAGIANLWLAVFADTGVALLAVANSMRIFRRGRGTL